MIDMMVARAPKQLAPSKTIIWPRASAISVVVSPSTSKDASGSESHP